MAGRVQHGSSRVRRITRLALAAAMLLTPTAFGQDVGPVPPAAAPSAAPAATAPDPAAIENRGLGTPKDSTQLPARPAKPGQSMPDSQRKPWLGQTAVSLAAVIGLALAAAAGLRFLARRTGGFGGSLAAGGRAPAGIMEILGRYPVGRGATLVLLKLDRRVLLLSQTVGGRFGAGAGFNTLCDITDPEEVASILVKSRDAEGDSMSERFRTILGRFDRTMGAAEEHASGRRVSTSSSGDRAELWDERNPIPVVDLTKQPGPPDASAAGSLRRRLASMRRSGSDGGPSA